MAHGTTVKRAIEAHGVEAAVAWADHIIEVLEDNVRSSRRGEYALADLILKGDPNSMFMAREMAKLVVQIREQRKNNNDEWEPKP